MRLLGLQGVVRRRKCHTTMRAIVPIGYLTALIVNFKRAVPIRCQFQTLPMWLSRITREACR